MDPRWTKGHYRCGLCLMKQERFTEAHDALTKAKSTCAVEDVNQLKQILTALSECRALSGQRQERMEAMD